MNTGCQQIDRALKLLQEEGNVVLEVSRWTKMNKVIYMRDKLTANIKNEIQSKIEGLNYWKAEGTPHDKPSEGFYCAEDSIALMFPR